MLASRVTALAVVLGWLLALPAAAETQATGRIENCDGFYPSTAAGAEGTTVITARIPLDGDLADAAVQTSSGRSDLDAAALACAARYYIRPAEKDGTPIETSWVFQIVWQARGHSYLSSPRPGPPTTCRRAFPGAYVGRRVGNTSLAFVIDADGSVSGARVTQSSGSAELDEAALGCVQKWRYFPHTTAGKPVAIDWQANVNWRTR